MATMVAKNGPEIRPKRIFSPKIPLDWPGWRSCPPSNRRPPKRRRLTRQPTRRWRINVSVTERQDASRHLAARIGLADHRLLMGEQDAPGAGTPPPLRSSFAKSRVSFDSCAVRAIGARVAPGLCGFSIRRAVRNRRRRLGCCRPGFVVRSTSSACRRLKRRVARRNVGCW
jgi:hypothetical protein